MFFFFLYIFFFNSILSARINTHTKRVTRSPAFSFTRRSDITLGISFAPFSRRRPARSNVVVGGGVSVLVRHDVRHDDVLIAKNIEHVINRAFNPGA